MAITMHLAGGSRHPPLDSQETGVRLSVEVSLVTVQVSGEWLSLNMGWINSWSSYVVLKQKPDDDETP